MIDRFVKDISIRTRDKESFSIRVNVKVSNQFFGWITGLGKEVQIISPTDIVEQYKEYLGGLLWKYK